MGRPFAHSCPFASPKFESTSPITLSCFGQEFWGSLPTYYDPFKGGVPWKVHHCGFLYPCTMFLNDCFDGCTCEGHALLLFLATPFSFHEHFPD